MHTCVDHICILTCLQEQDSSKEIQEREQRYEELMRVVDRLRREGEEEREEHSVELQGLRREMRDAADNHRHEILQSEVKHKVHM